MLENKKIIVFGAAGLLGSKLCKSLLEQGAHVIAVDLHIEVLKSKFSCVTNHDCLELQECDVNIDTDVQSIFEIDENIEGVVNCVYPRNRDYGKHFYDVNIESFNENLSLNVGSSFLLMQTAAKYFNENKNPISFVNISSIYGVVSPDFDIYKGTNMTMPVEYSAMKAAVLHMAKYIVCYIKNSNFRINSVSPGGLLDGQSSQFTEAYKAKTMGAGMLNVEDITGAVSFLLSERSRFVTGQNIIVDDGFCL